MWCLNCLDEAYIWSTSRTASYENEDMRGDVCPCKSFIDCNCPMSCRVPDVCGCEGEPDNCSFARQVHDINSETCHQNTALRTFDTNHIGHELVRLRRAVLKKHQYTRMDCPNCEWCYCRFRFCTSRRIQLQEGQGACCTSHPVRLIPDDEKTESNDWLTSNDVARKLGDLPYPL